MRGGRGGGWEGLYGFGLTAASSSGGTYGSSGNDRTETAPRASEHGGRLRAACPLAARLVRGDAPGRAGARLTSEPFSASSIWVPPTARPPRPHPRSDGPVCRPAVVYAL